MTADTCSKSAPTNLPVVARGEALPPHTLENVGSTELHVISTELKDPVRPDNV